MDQPTASKLSDLILLIREKLLVDMQTILTEGTSSETVDAYVEFVNDFLARDEAEPDDAEFFRSSLMVARCFQAFYREAKEANAALAAMRERGQ